MRIAFVILASLFALHVQASQDEKKIPSHDIAIEIKINCPKSEELTKFIESIPPYGERSANFDEWKSSFIHNMTQLIKLIESEKVYSSYWSAKVDDQPRTTQ